MIYEASFSVMPGAKKITITISILRYELVGLPLHLTLQLSTAGKHLGRRERGASHPDMMDAVPKRGHAQAPQSS